MNIWIYNHYVAAPGDFGITRHLDLARELKAKDHEITIFASSFNHWERKEKKVFEKKEKFIIENIDGINFVWIKTKPYDKNGLSRVLNMMSYWWNLKFVKLDKLAKKPDIVVGSIMHHFAGWAAYKAAKKYKAKFVFEERDLWPESLIYLAGLSRKHPLVKILAAYEKFMYKKASKIIVLFDKAPDYVKSKGIEDNKIVYLPNGASLSKSLSTKKISFIEENKTLLKQKIVIGYTGSLSLANNMDRVLKMAEMMKEDQDYIFVFVGEGSYKKHLISEAKTKGLNNCLFFPPVAKEDLPKVLAYFNYGVISLKDSPLYKFGFSLNKLYDYMAAELPLIIDTSIENNFIKEFNVGISGDNLEDIIKEIKMTSPNDYEQMKLNSKKYLLENHDWKILGDKFERDVMEVPVRD
ncbi:glycosyltransferase family 4 protein [Bhargavaea ginsengi]|uniref:glycosyltransferase family 4 protein n=1 Tax=Bhargavaea ginsengi TaxID=426757 RepID=UPI00203BB953|nr:glycosyltransferase family 4 protein [Bhargavaea ginsengi]MCM3088662.1 glycosyltransferase family 4 protein [Bhargavaea ginsengi]